MKFIIELSLKTLNGKRTVLSALAGVAVALSACAMSGRVDTADLSPQDEMLRHKYRGIHGGVLYLDASGHPKRYITMQTQSGKIWRVERNVGRGGGQSTFTDSMYIPKTIHVIWRTGDVREKRDEYGHANALKMGFEGGTVLGDYTVPVAERIPDEVLDYIRNNGGALRLKIRLKDNGVLIGWDVEKIVPFDEWKPGLGLHSGVNYLLPGGDFREAYLDGKALNPGWEK